jgi:acid phosphatase type 7
MLCLRLLRVLVFLFAPVVSLLGQSAVATGPTFVVPDNALAPSPVIIAYGDIRFTDPHETGATNPIVRRWLVDEIAKAKPDAILIGGDIPWHGANKSDYDVFRAETAAWSAQHLRVYPALGNHELYSHGLITSTEDGLRNWWDTFPELRGKRWYSVQLGSRVYVLMLDSTSSLRAGSEQMTWIRQQLSGLPPSVQFVFFDMHHPPVADVQRFGDPSHNPRRNEIALAHYLNSSPLRSRVRFIVVAAHIHNYERFSQEGVTYIVSGGGGAAPRVVHRNRSDLFQQDLFPNYHYLKFVLNGNALHATMYRVADPRAHSTPTWETPDGFTLVAPTAAAAKTAQR